MQNSNDPKQSAKWVVSTVALCILIYLGIQHLDVVWGTLKWGLNLLLPLVIGFVIALIINVPLRPLEQHLFRRMKNPKLQKLRRPICIVLALLIIISVFSAVVGMVIPELVEAFSVLGRGIRTTVDAIQAWLAQSETAQGDIVVFLNELEMNWNSIQHNLVEWAKAGAAGIMGSTVSIVSSVGSTIVNLAVAFVFAVYILANKETLKRQVSRLMRVWLPQQASGVLIHVAEVFNLSFRKFVSGQTVEAVILGSLCTFGMFLLRLPYAPMVGALVGVTALIPIVGAFIGATVGAFMILTVDPIKALVFIAFLLILQQVEGNLIYPRVVGSSLGLPAMWVLAAVTLGGSLGGIGGMLLGVPSASAIYTLVREATCWREEKLHLTEQASAEKTETEECTIGEQAE